MNTISSTLAGQRWNCAYRRVSLFVRVVRCLLLFLLTPPTVNSETFRVVVLGSSTAVGVGATPLDSSWVNRYKRYLQATVPESEVVNLATDGFSIFNVMPTDYRPPSPWDTDAFYPVESQNITYALSLDPSMIIVNLPSNDCNLHVPVALQVANYDLLMQEADAQGVPMWIASTQPRTNTDSIGRDLLMEMRDSIMARYAPHAIDFWNGLADDDGATIPEYDYDGSHLNNAGHAMLFERVQSTTTVPPTLPIQLATFTASLVSANAVHLAWSTVTETNNYGFTVQCRASNAKNFAQLPKSFVAGHGTTLQPQHYAFTDASVSSGHRWYRLKQIDLDGTVHYTDPVQVNVPTDVKEKNTPATFALEQNYPNPFNPTTIISYHLPAPSGVEGPAASNVQLVVYDLVGHEMALLVNERQSPGSYSVKFDATGLASGVYFYRLTAGNFVQAKSLMLLK
jgi:lysophospholipase L1-like esterase